MPTDSLHNDPAPKGVDGAVDINAQAEMIIKHETKSAFGRVVLNLTNFLKNKVQINNKYRNKNKGDPALETALKIKLTTVQMEGSISQKKLDKIYAKWNLDKTPTYPKRCASKKYR